MNIQNLREDLAEALRQVAPSGWQSTTETTPTIHTGLIQIGHAVTNVPNTFKTYAVTLRVTLWVNEADEKIGVSDLYALLSPGPLSVRAALKNGIPIEGTDRRVTAAGPMITEEVAPRDEGPTGFLAVDILVPLHISAD